MSNLDSGRLEDAKKMLESYFPEDDKSNDKDFAKSILHIKQGEYDKAIPYLTGFIEKSAQSEEIVKISKILSYSYIKTHQLKEARILLSGLSDEYQEDPEIQNMLAYIDYINGKVNIAFRRYCQVLRVHPGNMTAINAISYCMVDFFNQPYEALQLIRPYLNDDPRVLDTVAWAYYKMGKQDEAVKYINKALELMPDHKEIKEHQQIILKKK